MRSTAADPQGTSQLWLLCCYTVVLLYCCGAMLLCCYAAMLLCCLMLLCCYAAKSMEKGRKIEVLGGLRGSLEPLDGILAPRGYREAKKGSKKLSVGPLWRQVGGCLGRQVGPKLAQCEPRARPKWFRTVFWTKRGLKKVFLCQHTALWDPAGH